MVMGGEIPDLIELYNVLMYEGAVDLMREASEAFPGFSKIISSALIPR